RQLGKLNVVMIGVGAAFKFHSQEVPQAPQWMMKYSLEWLFRLFQEPRRLWSRYLLTNTAFIVLFSHQLLKHAFSSFTQRANPIDTLTDQ
ncbi:MAG: WecB/TagA/CpsF family glycosyltransferase, partial [Cyanobacteria bacterium J06555_13]